MAKDVFDTPPQGMVRSGKRGRIKPVNNPTLNNLRIKGSQLAQENNELKQRLVALEEAVLELVNKKGKK
jgi:hypothetical protein